MGDRRGPSPTPPRGREFAPAKINLALHVTGRRDDGYHLLDTLVVHARDTAAGDDVEAEISRDAEAIGRFDLALDGPFAAGLAADPDNLVLRAARLIEATARAAGRPGFGARLRLTKRLPIASGIGGGSSDAAATLRLLARLAGLPLSAADLARLALPLGADVPMCVIGGALRARGIGETVAPLPSLPPLDLVLVNPGVAVATPAVFRALAKRDNPPMADLPAALDAPGLIALLRRTRNDLQPAAVALAPAIGEAIDLLAGLDGVRLVRMSGSGATVVALTDDAATARAVAERVAAMRPGWWSAPTRA